MVYVGQFSNYVIQISPATSSTAPYTRFVTIYPVQLSDGLGDSGFITR